MRAKLTVQKATLMTCLILTTMAVDVEVVRCAGIINLNAFFVDPVKANPVNYPAVLSHVLVWQSHDRL